MMGLLYRVADALRRRSQHNDHGRMGEDAAHRYLRRHGCTVVSRNYRPRAGGGEIDLVVWHGSRLVFVEVKTRESEAFGTPESAVGAEKRAHLQHAARDYARRADVKWDLTRFDIVSVLLEKPMRIEWMKDAFR